MHFDFKKEDIFEKNKLYIFLELKTALFAKCTNKAHWNFEIIQIDKRLDFY